VVFPRTHPRGQYLRTSEFRKAIHILQLRRLSLFSALLKVLDPTEKDFTTHRDRIYACPKDRPDGKLAQLLDCMRGKAQLIAWMEPRVLQSVARKVYDEMDDVKISGQKSSGIREFKLRKSRRLPINGMVAYVIFGLFKESCNAT
jgi:hypothetical protein